MRSPTFPDPRLERLDIFTGTWRTAIAMLDGDGGETGHFSAIDIYRWMPGRYFLLHDVDAVMDGQAVKTLEIIGLDPETGAFATRSYDNAGNVGNFTARLDGKTWTIDGGTIRFEGSFSSDGQTLSGQWERAEGTRWVPWMTVTLRKADA